MVRARPSHLVITASMASLRPPYTRSQALYTASKFAVLGFAEALVPEIEPHGIGLTVVFPGPVQTNLVAGAEHRRPGSVPHGVEALPLPEGLADLEIESIDGDEAGRRIVDAVRAGRRYFGTHPEMLAQVQLPQREIARGFAPLN
jgi:NAD(P)-dependent dehydrogenase (short-subunit alcohol dehydrogenase family)